MKTKNIKKKRARRSEGHELELEENRDKEKGHIHYIHLFFIMSFVICFVLLFAGVCVVSASITSWSNTKTGDNDTMFLVNQGETITFSISPSGTYEWQLNKEVQSATGNSFTWRVPNEKDIWEIHVTDGTDHIEWVVSTLSIDEAPDIFDYFADKKSSGRTETDPWGRALPEWSGDIPVTSECNIKAISTTKLTLGSSIVDGTWKFRYKFRYPYPASHSEVYFYPLYKANVFEFYYGKYFDAHHHCVFQSWGIHDGQRTQFSIDYDGTGVFEDGEWHEVIIVRKDKYLYVFKEVKHEAFNGIMFEMHAYEPVEESDSIRIFNWLGSGSDNYVYIDGIEVYEGKYLFPPKKIYIGNYFYDHTTGPDQQIAPLWKEGIIVSGRNVTLKDIADSINNPSIFSYNPITKTAICYKDLVVDEAAELIIKDETLKFHSNYDGEVHFVLDYGSRLYVENSTITSDTDKYFTWNIAGSTTHWGNEIRMYWPGEPVGYYKSGGHRPLEPAYHGEFIVKNSVINNCAHLFFDSPYEINITNSQFTNLHEIDIGTYPFLGGNYRDARDFPKGEKSFWLYTDTVNINDFVIRDVTFSGVKSPLNLTFSVNAHRDKYNIYNIDAENENIVIKESFAQNYGQSHSCYIGGSTGPWGKIYDSYQQRAYIASEIGIVNSRFKDIIITPGIFTDGEGRPKEKAAFVKYYLDVKVVNESGNPVPNATVSVNVEQSWTEDEMKTNHYPVENMAITKPYATGNYNCFYHHYRFVDGQPLSSTITGSDGHTPLPFDRVNTFVITDYKKYRDTATGEVKQDNFTYTITASYDGRTASISGLDIDETWYRENPNIPTKTVVCNLGTGACYVEGVATGTISGTVTNSTNGASIAGARIEVGAWYDNTDENGEYTISNIPVGTYTVTASADGYESSSETATVTADNTTTVNFVLNPVGDIFSPTTNATITPTPNEAGWNNITPVVVTFFRGDSGGSGISYTNYSKLSETGPWTTVGISAAIGHDAGNVTDISEGKFNVSVSDEGTTEIWYYSVDNNSNVEATKKVTVRIDTVSPVIYSNVSVSDITGSSAVISWTTDEIANSLVKYGTSSGSYTSEKSDATYTKSHSIALTGLTANKTYYYSVSSTDQAGNSAQSDEYNFTTSEETNLVAEWHFNEGNGTAAVDSSGNGNDGTIYGANWTTGKIERALEFDGLDDYIEVPDSTSLDITDVVTVVAWIQPNTVVGERSVFGKQDAYAFKTSSSEIRFTTPGIKDHTSIGAGLVTGSWQHIAVVFVAGDIVKFYKNGQFISSTSASMMSSSTYPLLIGNNQWNERFDGVIDEVKIYSRALSAEEIKADYEAGLEDTTPPASISDLQNTTGTTWINWTWTNPSDNDFAYTMVYLNGVFKTNTSNPYYNATGLVANTTYEIGTHTVDTNGNVNPTWVNQTAKTLAVPNSPPYKPGNPSPSDGAVNIPIDTDLSWTGGDPDAGDTVTYDVYFGTDSNPPLISENQTETTYDPGILNSSTRYYWKVEAEDEYGASNESEVWTFTTASASGSDLVGLWHLDEGTGVTALDSSGNGNNGTLVNDPVWVDGKINKSLQFDGTTNYIEIPSSQSLNSINSEITIIAWIKTDFAQRGTIVDNWFYDKTVTPQIGERAYVCTAESGADAGKFAFGLSPYGNGSGAVWLKSNTAVNPAQWVHVAFVSNATNMSIYINGSLDAITSAPSQIYQSHRPIHIGAWNAKEVGNPPFDTFFNGTIDEVKIYNRALTAEEIKADYEAGLVDLIPPASIYNLENRSGATWINWTWTNPSDSDFAYTMVYLDGVFKTNTSNPYYNATGLVANTTYEIGTHTVDVNDNVNDTWVNQTAKTTLLLLPFPGCDNPPTDQDGDGIYEDINGNDELGFADVVIFTTNIEWIRDNEPIEHFDFNMDGKIDDNDLNILSEKVEGER